MNKFNVGDLVRSKKFGGDGKTVACLGDKFGNSKDTCVTYPSGSWDYSEDLELVTPADQDSYYVVAVNESGFLDLDFTNWVRYKTREAADKEAKTLAEEQQSISVAIVKVVGRVKTKTTSFIEEI